LGCLHSIKAEKRGNFKLACSSNGKASRTTTHKLGFLLPVFFSLLKLITPVHAEADINLQEIPTQLAEALGIPTFAGQMIMSSIVMLTGLLPIAILTRKGRGSWIPEVAVTFVIMGSCIAIGWLPYWFLLIICLFVALMFSGTMRDLITGKGK